MILQLLSPFAVAPPDLFSQLIFLLLLWGIVELIAIPLEAFNDKYVFDYQHNWISLHKDRFFYKNDQVIANFNQILAVGVSARAEGVYKKLFSESPERYAIFCQIFGNKLIRVTDYNLGLDKANNFAEKFCYSQLAAGFVLPGEENKEIVLNAQTGELSLKEAKRDSLSIVDGITIPVFQSLFSVIFVYFVFSLSFFIIDLVSTDVFNTNLFIPNQPVMQLIAGSDNIKKPTTCPIDFQRPVKNAKANKQNDIKVIIPSKKAEEKSGYVSLDFDKRIVKIHNPESVSKAIPVIDKKDDLPRVQVATNNHEKIDLKQAEILPTEVATSSTKTAENANVMVANLSNASKSSKIVIKNEKPVVGIRDTEKKLPLSIENTKRITKTNVVSNIPVLPKIFRKPINNPINGKIPSVSFKTLNLKKEKISEIVANKIDKNNKIIKTKNNEKEKLAINMPVSMKLRDSLAVNVDVSSALNEKTAKKTFKKSTRKPMFKMAKSKRNKATLLPGYGISEVVEINKPYQEVMKKLKEPLMKFKSSDSWQIIYPSFTIITDLSKHKIIKRINVTKNISAKLGKLSTFNDVTIGTPMDYVKAKYGSASLIDSSPGLHYPSLGISFIPDLSNNTVASIELYQREKK